MKEDEFSDGEDCVKYVDLEFLDNQVKNAKWKIR